MIVMGKLTSKLKTKEAEKTTQENQAGKFATSKKLNVDFCLPEFSATNIVTWKCHVDKSTNGRYDMILGRYLLTALGLNIKFYKNVIIGGEGPYEGCSESMVDISKYDFNIITDEKFKHIRILY